MGFWEDAKEAANDFGTAVSNTVGGAAQASGLSQIKKEAERFGSNVNTELDKAGMRVDTLEGIVDVATQYYTFGLVGVKDGRPRPGLGYTALDELSGQAGQRRDREARDRALADEEAKRAQDAKYENERRARQDIQASQQAGMLQEQSQRQSSLGLGGGDYGNEYLTKDYLGLR